VNPDEPYYQGEAWYRTLLTVVNPYPHGRTLLRFAGAGQRTEVFAFTTKVAEHAGGYDAFEVDLTEALETNAGRTQWGGRGSLPLAIRCSNARDFDLVPSDLSDFTLHGGIYRSLEVVYVPAISIEHFTVSPSISDKGGQVALFMELRNPAGLEEEVRCKVALFDAEQQLVCDAEVRLPAWSESRPLKVLEVPAVQRWSVENPRLYTLKVMLSSVHGMTAVEKRFGFRSFEFVENGPFTLNDQRLLLRGTHRHEDHADVGAAMTDEQILAEMQLIKQMGVNFIRLGHYQQNDHVLDLCDELGLLVWEEIPWCRGGLGGDAYQGHAREMLKRMIRQHHHHPSIVLWGLGNENDWPGDFEEFEKSRIRAFMVELHQLAKRKDPSRLTCIRRCDFCSDVVDVYSPSIWAGWYRGNYRQYREELEMTRQRIPRWVHVEWGADCHAGRHAENPYENIGGVTSSDGADERGTDFLRHGGDFRVSRDGDWSETYCCDLIDWHLKEQSTFDWFTGSAYWPFKDFSTPLRKDNPIPYVNQKGVVQRNLEPKEAFYVFQSHWSVVPMVRIYGHTWKYRWGREDDDRLVRIYSNCPEVELFLNGASLGTKRRDPARFPCSGLNWVIPFCEGENSLVAMAHTQEGFVLTDEVKFTYLLEIGDEPVRIALEAQSGDDGAVVLNASLWDVRGRLCVKARNVLRCEVFGEGRLRKDLGCMGGASVVEAANGQAFWHVDVSGAPLIIAVRSAGLETAYYQLSDQNAVLPLEEFPSSEVEFSDRPTAHASRGEYVDGSLERTGA